MHNHASCAQFLDGSLPEINAFEGTGPLRAVNADSNQLCGREVGIRQMINGPIPITADGEPVIGLSPELDNFYLCCGFTSGIAASGPRFHEQEARPCDSS